MPCDLKVMSELDWHMLRAINNVCTCKISLTFADLPVASIPRTPSRKKLLAPIVVAPGPDLSSKNRTILFVVVSDDIPLTNGVRLD
jgi:hypothetical protein